MVKGLHDAPQKRHEDGDMNDMTMPKLNVKIMWAFLRNSQSWWNTKFTNEFGHMTALRGNFVPRQLTGSCQSWRTELTYLIKFKEVEIAQCTTISPTVSRRQYHLPSRRRPYFAIIMFISVWSQVELEHCLLGVHLRPACFHLKCQKWAFPPSFCRRHLLKKVSECRFVLVV